MIENGAKLIFAREQSGGLKVRPRIIRRVAMREANLAALCCIVDVAARLGMTNEAAHAVLPPQFTPEHTVKLLARFEPFVASMFLPAPLSEKPRPWIDEFDGKELLNPFAKETEDLASQILLRNQYPDLATELEMRALPITYAMLHKRREETRHRSEMRSYDGPNPWCDETEYSSAFLRGQAQAVLEDGNPILAQQLKDEASMTGVAINPWLLGGNATRQTMMYKRDAALALLCRTAAFTQRNQLDAEAENLRDQATGRRCLRRISGERQIGAHCRNDGAQILYFAEPCAFQVKSTEIKVNHWPSGETWFKAMRSDDAMELLRLNSKAFVLLYVIAFRARRTTGFNRYGLLPGEAIYW